MNGFAYTRNRDVCSGNLRRLPVRKLQFSQDGATLVSADDSETLTWDVATGARKDKVGGQLAFTKTDIGSYIVAAKDDLLFIYDTRVGANDGADGKEKVLTAFFRAPSPIEIIRVVSCAGDKIAVCCENFAVVTLHAAWLTD